MPTLPTIAVIENDDALRSFLLQCLQSEKYTAWGAASAEEFYRTWAVSKTDIVTIDLGLPGEDGLSVVNHLRQNKDIAIIVITGREGPQARIAGLEAGADHYLTKPLYKRELLGAIEAFQWRKQSSSNPDAPMEKQWRLHTSKLKLVLPDERALMLTEREGWLIDCLIKTPGEVVDRDTLHAATFPENLQNNRQVDVIISRLREKMKRQFAVALPIRTVFGKGFAFIS
jgi:two-component system response regulator PhoP